MFYVIVSLLFFLKVVILGPRQRHKFFYFIHVCLINVLNVVLISSFFSIFSLFLLLFMFNININKEQRNLNEAMNIFFVLFFSIHPFFVSLFNINANKLLFFSSVVIKNGS